MSEQGGWHRVAKSDEVSEDQPKQVRVGDVLIGLYKLDGAFYALHDICTHEYACLTDGWVEGEAIECPLHQARFDIRSGKVLELPATEDVRTYPVKLEGDDIYVQVEQG